MWIKHFEDGSHLQENVATGCTWMKTPLSNISMVQLRVKGPHGGYVEYTLRGFRDYWHSKTMVANDSCKPIIVAERIQGLREDGKWETVEWKGQKFIESVQDKAIGKPVIKK